MNSKWLVVLTMPVLLAACSNMQTQQQMADRAARVQAAAGPPVTHFTIINPGLYSWYAINDHQLVVYDTLKKAYLLDLPACPGLQSTPGINISSRMQQVSKNLDNVTTMQMGIPCPIKQIRPIDLDKLKASKVDKRQIEATPRPDADASTSNDGS